MSVKFKSNTSKIILDTQAGVSLALRFMLDGIDKEAFPNTPKDQGNLRQDTIKQVLGRTAKIQWTKEYAAAQEAGTTRGFPIVNYTTPGTGPKFAENAVKKVFEDSENYFKKARVIK